MSIRIFPGDCRNVLKTLPDESVHCVVTSPPYWGLRDYGTATWEGGDAECDHSPEKRGSRFATPVSAKQASNTGSGTASKRDCDCGARRIDSQIGLEPSFTEYVETMRAVFREVRRVLRKDGTVFLNLGDSYANDGKWGGETGGLQAYLDNNNRKQVGRTKRITGLKPKDLCGIPWRVAFALQADGWYLRSDIIWSKPNPMPESVTDRPTKAHEYLFLLTKSERYYYDAAAIAEDALRSGDLPGGSGGFLGDGANDGRTKKGLRSAADIPVAATRNRRSVWEIATAPYSEAHFATFPPALVEPCIKAGCPHKACAKCGAPWVREAERHHGPIAETLNPKTAARIEMGFHGAKPGLHEPGWRKHPPASSKTLGFSPSCSCNAETVPGTVLDCFGGAGTTGLVADRLGRNAILIELNADYAIMAERRLRNDAGMFAQVT